MGRYWLPPLPGRGLSPEQMLENLAPLGVVEGAAPRGPSYYFLDEESGYLMKEVGATFVYPHNGRIRVVPRVGITTRDRRVLLGHADLTFREKPSRASGWLHRRGKAGSPSFWYTAVQVVVGDDDEQGRMIMHAARQEECIAVITDRLDISVGIELAGPARPKGGGL